MIKPNLKIKEKVGIGIVSFRRYNEVSTTCRTLSKLIKGHNIKAVVADDGSEFRQETHGIKLVHGDNQGVSINKNRVLYELRDCDYIFIIEDDVQIHDLRFVSDFIKFSKDSGVQSMFYGPIEDWPFWTVTSREGNRIRYATSEPRDPKLFYSTGSFTALTKEALHKCGGLSARFQHLGLEHMEWALRLHKMGLSDDKPQDYFTLDFSNSLSFYNVFRNLRREEATKNNIEVYYDLIEKPVKNDDYLDPEKLWLENSKFKIFGLGLSRTGTTSLNDALNILGFNSVHYPVDGPTINQLTTGNLRLEILNEYDAITDITIIPFWDYYFHNCPNSKFILTTRENNSWIESLARHWNEDHEFAPIGVNWRKLNPLTRMLLQNVYGGYEWNVNRFLSRKSIYEKGVIEFFDAHKDRFLLMNIAGGEGWEILCPFLGVEEPTRSFPFLGKSVNVKGKKNWI